MSAYGETNYRLLERVCRIEQALGIHGAQPCDNPSSTETWDDCRCLAPAGTKWNELCAKLREAHAQIEKLKSRHQLAPDVEM